jgi:hypothetical protein
MQSHYLSEVYQFQFKVKRESKPVLTGQYKQYVEEKRSAADKVIRMKWVVVNISSV